MNGTYGFVYSGELGVGMGILRITDSILVGQSLAGGKYRGTAVLDEATGEIALSFQMTVPPGVMLVQGTAAQDLPYTKEASVKVPADFGNGKPFDVFIPPGNVTLMIKRIPDEWAPYADGMVVDIRPAT